MWHVAVLSTKTGLALAYTFTSNSLIRRKGSLNHNMNRLRKLCAHRSQKTPQTIVLQREAFNLCADSDAACSSNNYLPRSVLCHIKFLALKANFGGYFCARNTIVLVQRACCNVILVESTPHRTQFNGCYFHCCRRRLHLA